MKKRYLIRASLSIASGIALTAISGTAIADGLQSQFKARIPMYPGYIQTFEKKDETKINRVQVVSMPASKQEIAAMIVRRNQRAVKRRKQWFSFTTKIVAEAKIEATLPVNTGNRVVRPRLIYRGSRATATANCNNLHTHERAVCLHEQQVQKMLRHQK